VTAPRARLRLCNPSKLPRIEQQYSFFLSWLSCSAMNALISPAMETEELCAKVPSGEAFKRLVAFEADRAWGFLSRSATRWWA
jgi:hypothetical protein